MPSSPFSEDEHGVYCRECTFELYGSREAFEDHATDITISISALNIIEGA